MKKLCIVIPTRNHGNYIKYYIDCIGESLTKYDVDLYIGDSSDNSETQAAAYSSDNKNVVYKFYSDEICKDGEQKIYQMFSELSKEYEYIWLCGDGYIPKLAAIYPMLSELMDKGYTVISMMAPNRSRFPQRYESREYLSATEMFHDLYWHLTYWGTSIFRNTVAEYFVRSSGEIGGRKSSFVVLTAIFAFFAEYGCFAYNYVGDVYSENIHKEKSTWRRKDILLEIWAKSWCDAIDDLPALYDQEKRYVMRSNDENLNFFCFTHLLNWKYEGDLSLKSVSKYKEYIQKATRRPLILFYLASLCPRLLLKLPKALFLEIKKRKSKKFTIQNRMEKGTVYN